MRNLQLSPEIIAKLNVPQVEDITDILPINQIKSWSQLAGTRELIDLTTIALHHDAWPKKNTVGKYTDLQLAAKMANDHIASKKYDATGEGGIPYHIWIRSGRIYQCNNILDRIYGVGSNNGYTVHICVSGDYYNYDTLTDADRNALYGAILMIKSVLPSFKEIKGHKEFSNNNTDCPGYDFVKVRNDILTLQNQMVYANSDSAAKIRAHAIANQILYFANLSEGKDPYGNPASEGDIQWGKNVLLELEPFMVERGLL